MDGLGLDVGRPASEAKVFGKRIQPFENQHEDAGIDLLSPLMVVTILPPTLHRVVTHAVASGDGAHRLAGERLRRCGSLDLRVNVASWHHILTSIS